MPLLKNIFPFFLILFLIFLIYFNFFWKENLNKIIFLNVGQGNAVLLKTKEGNNILIDSGNERVANRSLIKELGFFDRKLDLVFATHYDMDHVGLLPFYIKFYEVKNFVDSGLIPSTKDSQWFIFSEIRKLLENKKINKKSLKGEDIIIFNDNLKIEVLFPEKFLNLENTSSNSSSLVLMIHFQDNKILLTGDLPSKFEKYLIKRYGKNLKADILLAGHHGSKTSSSREFLEAVSPKYLIISAGSDNNYGHPSKEVLDLAKELNLKVLRTDLLGNISFTFVK